MVMKYIDGYYFGLNVKPHYCHDPSFGLATKVRACTGVDQEGSLGMWENVRMNTHTPK